MREKINALREIAGDEFLCNELIGWLSASESDDFAEHVIRMWDITELQDDEEDEEEESEESEGAE
jgi:hypothetical protein